jgi:microcin C transport system substrate-binding protein
MLHAAGYTLRNNQLYAPHSQTPIVLDVLLNDPADEKLALAWARDAKRLGITINPHTADSAQYQARLANFDFDVTTAKWINTLSPGNEQIFYWGAAAADQKGSRNYAGIKDPTVDALANAIPAAPTREELVADVHALDRVLMRGHYVIPFYYLGADQIAWWTLHLREPDASPLYGAVLESWWYQ